MTRRLVTLTLAAAGTLAWSCGREDVVLRVREPIDPPVDAAVPGPQDGGGPGATGGSAGTDGAPDGGVGGIGEISFAIRTDESHPIAPEIYGFHFPDGNVNEWPVQVVRPGLLRTPGFRQTTYNWEINASNGGASWCYSNEGFFGGSLTPGDAITRQLRTAADLGATLNVTIPISRWVAADRKGSSPPPDCDGDVTLSGPTWRQTRFHRNEPRNESRPSPVPYPPDTTDEAVYQDEFVSWLRGTVRSMNARVIVSLDRSPDFWSYIHRELYPTPPTFSEICERSVAFARAVKEVWPDAIVSGYSGKSWNGLTDLGGSPDAAGKGLFVEHFLDCMRTGSMRAGRRLLDVLDVSWPTASNIGEERVNGDNTTDAIVRERVQAPRSFWDETYVEKSWITQVGTNGPIKLLPRLRAMIAAHFPGTEIGISEWSFGGDQHISGGIAAADLFGVLGRERVAWAAAPTYDQPSYTSAALQMFRNFDGKGGKFGDRSVEATTSDVFAATAYASVASSDGRLVLVLINKTNQPLVAKVSLTHATPMRRASVYTLTAVAAEPRPAPELAIPTDQTFRYTMPARSVNVIAPTP